MLPFAAAAELPLHSIVLPQNFAIELYARVPGARSMVLGPRGTLFVGTRHGTVYAVRNDTEDHRADRVLSVADGLDTPNGVAFRDGALYVAEVSRILRYDDIETHLDAPPDPVVVSDRFPSDAHHGWKFIRFGPDGKLYVPVGAPCNICDAGAPYATIMRMNPDGSSLETFARGVRNTVGFDWHPESSELWFTDNGRDWLGDRQPPDELNRAPQSGLHFGYPYCHGKNIPDPEFGAIASCEQFTPPAQELGAHVAALGMKFYRGPMFPAKYRNQVFIPEHGSWNSSVPVGYRLTLVRLRGNQPLSYEVFAEGWLQGGYAWGRPVALEVLADGSMLVSDDKAGAIYRIIYR